MRLRPERLGDSRIMKNLGENSDMPDLAQHSCNRTVYSRSGATRLQQQKGSFRSEDSRCGATPPLRDDCVRVNSFGTGSQHIPDLEQHPYHMLVNTFVRFDTPDLKQHRCYGTVYGSTRFIMYYYDFLFFFRVAFVLLTLGIACI